MTRSIATLLAILSVAATPAAAADPLQLPKLPDNDGNAPALKAGATYGASLFPVALHVTIPDGTWLGGQGELNFPKRGHFGWFELLQRPNAGPRGAMSVIASYDPTASVAATVARLRMGTGATFKPPSPVRIAGFSGRRFDGEVVAAHHTFIPFSPPSHDARFYPDAYRFDHGEVFRMVVLDVKGATVVFLIENVALPTDEFPAFLTSVDRVLGSLRFSS
jgi:hypothetical protein